MAFKQKRKINLMEVMGYLDSRDLQILDNYSNDIEKEKELLNMTNWIIPQWFSSSTNDNDEKSLVNNFNENCNSVWSNIYDHPKLKIKLLATCGLEKNVRRRFKKFNNSIISNRIRIFLETMYPDIRDNEVKLWCRNTTEEELVSLCKDFGYQNNEISEILKSFQKTQGGD